MSPGWSMQDCARADDQSILGEGLGSSLSLLIRLYRRLSSSLSSGRRVGSVGVFLDGEIQLMF